MSLITALALASFTALVGYVFGIAKDRSNKKTEAVIKLYDRVIEIQNNTLFAGENNTNHTIEISVLPNRKDKISQLGKVSGDYVKKLQQWRDDLYDEERRARLWLSKGTVDIVSNYLTLMMICKSWEYDESWEGSLIENKYFLMCVSNIFGNTEGILKDESIVVRHSDTKAPQLVNCVRLSNECLEVIRKHMKLDIVLFPRIQACFQRRLPSNFR